MKIVADDKIPFLQGVFEPVAEVEYLPGDAISNEVLKNADVLLTRSITECDEDLLHGTAVKFIASATIGFDHIDKQFCEENNIKWSVAAGCNAGAVSQYMQAVLLRLAMLKNLNLEGKTIGIIGVGNIGSRVHETAKFLGMKALLNDPPRKRKEGPVGFSELEELQEKADIVSLHVPLTYGGDNKTFHMVDARFLEGFRKSPMVINTSRGAVIDTAALKAYAAEGKVSGMVLDVWENEPDIDLDLLRMADLATPHIAGYSVEGKVMGTVMAVRAVSRFFDLGLEDWMPPAEQKQIRLAYDCAGMGNNQLLSAVFDSVYPISKDSDTLKNNPELFEEIRRAYRFRYENSNYLLSMKNCNEELARRMTGMGFQMAKNEI